MARIIAANGRVVVGKGAHTNRGSILDAVGHTNRIIPSPVTSNPESKRRIYLASRAKAQAFKAEYVSLAVLAAQRCVHIRKLLARLRRAGIEPAFDPKTLKARFYRRSDLDAA